MAADGGPSYSVPRLAEALIDAGWAAEIATLKAPTTQTVNGVPITSFRSDDTLFEPLTKLGRSRAMARGLMSLGGDVLHSHGLWMMPNVYPARIARQARRPLVLAPRGMLGADALKYSATAKKIFWAIWQKHAVEEVSCFHATADSEFEDIRAFGLNAPVAVVPNGIDIPARSEPSSQNPATPFVLSLGRFHPKKGLESLIAAFAQVAGDFAHWQLRLVGTDQGGHGDVLRQRIIEAGLEGRATVEEPVFGDEKYKLMAEAALFALPSLHENFAITVAESLAMETPVIASHGAPWDGLEKHGCGWWIANGQDPLAATLRNAMVLPPEVRAEMGARGRDWMRRDFAWEGVAARMSAVYDWLVGRGSQPTYVIL